VIDGTRHWTTAQHYLRRRLTCQNQQSPMDAGRYHACPRKSTGISDKELFQRLLESGS
jgi:hypothetical protein